MLPQRTSAFEIRRIAERNMEHISEGHALFAEPRSEQLPRKRAATRFIWIAAASAIAVAGLSWWFWYGSQRPEATTLPQPTLASAPASVGEPALIAPPTPAIRHPVEHEQPMPPTPLPTLDQSDARLMQALGQLMDQRSLRSLLQTDGLVRRFVATVDNLQRKHAASQRWPVNPTPARFLAARSADQEFIDADNSLRYTPFVVLVEQVDVGRAVSMYASFYPLFQQAYEELGYPNRYFNDRLIEVIDHLLAAPEPAGPVAVRLIELRGPMRMTRPWVHYEFADPELEALSAGQKLMVRVGPVNETRLKARLRAFRAALVARPGSR
jgi:hypothetical protein